MMAIKIRASVNDHRVGYDYYLYSCWWLLLQLNCQCHIFHALWHSLSRNVLRLIKQQLLQAKVIVFRMFRTGEAKIQHTKTVYAITVRYKIYHIHRYIHKYNLGTVFVSGFVHLTFTQTLIWPVLMWLSCSFSQGSGQVPFSQM